MTHPADADPLPRIDSEVVAAAVPYAMVNDGGDVFYPDNPQDEAYYAAEHGARPVNPPGAGS